MVFEKEFSPRVAVSAWHGLQGERVLVEWGRSKQTSPLLQNFCLMKQSVEDGESVS